MWNSVRLRVRVFKGEVSLDRSERPVDPRGDAEAVDEACAHILECEIERWMPRVPIVECQVIDRYVPVAARQRRYTSGAGSPFLVKQRVRQILSSPTGWLTAECPEPSIHDCG